MENKVSTPTTPNGIIKPEYRVSWKHLTTGIEGHGEWCDDESLVKEWVSYMNKENPALIHWKETKPE